MRTNPFISKTRALVLAVLCCGLLFGGNLTALAGNRCKDRCNEVYRLRKDVCRSIPLKGERKRCEKAAKRAKDDCKHRCR